MFRKSLQSPYYGSHKCKQSGLLIADAQTINLSEGAQKRATGVVGFANRFLIAGLDGSTRGGSEVKIDAHNADAKIAFARENNQITVT